METLASLFYIFIHAGICHLTWNILSLVYLGGFAERSIDIAILFCLPNIRNCSCPAA
ncbi:MAG: rhomboid family intramembrane serine protease [Nitrososphaeraceae archaeon]|nr:rhomboid family intramembrane serine protease [Nitrososphaeraceae archaeon]